MFKFRFKIPLRRKLLFFLLLVGILPLLIISLLTSIQVQNSLKTSVSNNLTSLSVEVMRSIEGVIQDVYSDVELLAANPLIKSKEASRQEKLSEMRKIHDFYGIFEDITLVDLKGNVIASTTYLSSPAWITKQYYQAAKEGQTSISPVHISLAPFKVILVSASPVKDKAEKITGVVAGQLNMETVWDITKRISVGAEGFAFMINKGGDFIAHPDTDKILSKAPYSQFTQEVLPRHRGVVNYTDEDGEQMIAGFVSLSDPRLVTKGWKLVIAQPVKEAYALVTSYQRQALGLFVGLLIFIVIMNYFLSGTIVRPIRQLTDATRKIAEGKLDTRIEVKTGDEIEYLSTSFNKMTIELKKYREYLEKAKEVLETRVKERTKELEEARSVLEIKVQARTKELKTLTESLEVQVTKRTKELQGRIDELERFHKLTVGRELQMVEMKKEIQNLKKELNKKKS